MPDFTPSEFEAQAATVPTGISQALAEGAGSTPAEYLANAAAAAQAVAVVDGLASSGVEVLDSRLDGTRLIVNVPSIDDAAAVQAVNAIAEIGEPADDVDYSAETYPALAKDLEGGQGFFSTKTTGTTASSFLCSVGFNGTDTTAGAASFVTAGHCRLSSNDEGRAIELIQNRPGSNIGAGSTLGTAVAGANRLGEGYDVDLARTATGWTPRPVVGTWGDGANNAPVTAGTPVAVRDYSRAVVGQPICKSGRTTGWTCGTILKVDVEATVSVSGTSFKVNSYVSNLCALGGDSGGPVISNTNAIGLISYGSFQKSCGETGKVTGFFPMASAAESVSSALPSWELQVSAPTPSVTVPAAGTPLYLGQRFQGRVTGGSDHYSVRLVVDGSQSFSTPVSSTGAFSIDVSSLPVGDHSYTLESVFESGTSVSPPRSGTLTVSAKPAVQRISGADRFDVAVAVADRMYPTTTPVVYLATGYNYPDALSAGPAAVKQGGPLLLVLNDSIPSVVADKLRSLSPERVVVVGGPNSVNESVIGDLAALVPDAAVSRLSGADRYEASRNVVAAAFGSAEHAYLATGANFPDALSAGGAAGSRGEPVVLVNGSAAAADAPTLGLFDWLKTSSITAVGGVNSVSDGVLTSLATGVPATVNREDGGDRFAASIALNQSAFTSTDTVYLATGYNFPDALTGGVLAGKTGSPLYVVPTECVPRGVLADIDSLGATEVVLLGGPNSLSESVANLAACAF